MVDDIHRKGSGPGISDKESAYYAGGPQTAKRHADDELLSKGGHITSSGHNSLQDQIAEKEKREESSRSLLIQAMIDDLESRNDELYILIQKTEEELKGAEKSREEIIPRLKAAEEKLATCDKDRHEAEKILEEIQQKTNTAQDLVQQAQMAFPDDFLSDDLVQITFDLHNGDRFHIADVAVAVYRENGRYYFINPLTGQPQEVTDEQKKTEIEKQLKAGKKTYDTASEGVKHQIEHYNEAAHNFMVHALHADEHEAELENAKKNYETKKGEYEKQLNEVRDLGEQLQAKDNQIKDIENRMSRYKDELEENRIKLAKLYEEREQLQATEESAKSQLRKDRHELYQALREQRGAAEKYLEAAEAQDAYSKKAREASENYKDCKKDERALREMGVALVAVTHQDPAHPDSHAHMVHTVHRDEVGYYYLDADNTRQELNADSIKPGTKAVEDILGEPQVQEAVLIYDQKADRFHRTLHEFEELNEDTESFARNKSSTDVIFSNEKPLAPGLTETGVFSAAAGQPYTEPSVHERHHTPAVTPPKNGRPGT